MRSILTLVLAMSGAGLAGAQVSPEFVEFARPGLNWYTIDTEHFSVHFHADSSGSGASRSARVVARIAEDVYWPITTLYDYEPDSRIHIILKDYEDYSNGAAYFFDNKIEIWTPALDSPLRGDHGWLRNVITHEFTHIVQVQSAMKAARTWPLTYVQVLGYERARRPDVLYGYPNMIVSYPLLALNNPAWLAEGTAQYQRTGLFYDRWDTHRDMLLRTRLMAGKALSLTEIGSFYSKSSLMRESVYNHGYAFTRYLARTYGEESLASMTRSLGRWHTFRVEAAIKRVTGDRGRAVYESWLQELSAAYTSQMTRVLANLKEGVIVEPNGFANHYPTFSPDGSRLAYISNKGEHYSRMSLYVQDLAGERISAFDLGPARTAHICPFGHKLRTNVTGGASWRPDGTAIVYAKHRTNAEGYRYADLYVLDLETENETRLTFEARATQPSWAPEGSRIAYVQQGDGTTNLMVLHLEAGQSTPVTTYADGTQVTGPSWAGDWIYFALLAPGGHERDLWRVRADGSKLEPVVNTSADERSPTVWNGALYFASDASGIYNIHRFENGQKEQLTRVAGGAFMPTVRADGGLAYAHFQWDGYKIAFLDNPQRLKPIPPYMPPTMLAKPAAPDDGGNDADLRALTHEELWVLNRDRTLTVVQDDDSLDVTSYRPAFTRFSVFPVLRLDQYVARRLEGRVQGRGEALWRNFKLGTYASSREILEDMSLFGGLLIGPGSRKVSSTGAFFAPANLLSLERDAFLQFEYRKGFRFMPKRWSPQVAFELFNIQRRVEGGLAIEEFPCTACLPDTTRTDLTYALWEGGIYVRSKLNRTMLLEVGYRYSPYRVNTDQFYSRELQTPVPGSSSRYFIGRSFLASWYFTARTPYREEDIMPEGIVAKASYERELGRLLRRFEIKGGQLSPVYGSDALHRLALEVRAGRRLPGQIRGAAHGIALHLRASTTLGLRVDAFYNDYMGGLAGARGYPFYALGGTEAFWVQTAWLFPLWPDIKRQVGPLYFDKAFARFYLDAVRVRPASRALRKDIGAEVRLQMGSYYLLPTSLFLSATYGIDAFHVALDEAFVTSRRNVRYGRDVLWHFGVLFGFDV